MFQIPDTLHYAQCIEDCTTVGVPAHSVLSFMQRALRDITALAQVEEVNPFLSPIRAAAVGEPGGLLQERRFVPS